MDMQIIKSYNLTRNEAKIRLDSFLEILMKFIWPSAIKVTDPTKNWIGNVMNFSFVVKKRILFTWWSFTMSGQVKLYSDEIVWNSDFNGTIFFFVPKSFIEEVIKKEFRTLFP